MVSTKTNNCVRSEPLDSRCPASAMWTVKRAHAVLSQKTHGAERQAEGSLVELQQSSKVQSADAVRSWAHAVTSLQGSLAGLLVRCCISETHCGRLVQVGKM